MKFFFDDLFGHAFKMMVALKDRFTITRVLQHKANVKKENCNYLLTNQWECSKTWHSHWVAWRLHHNKFKLKNYCYNVQMKSVIPTYKSN